MQAVRASTGIHTRFLHRCMLCLALLFVVVPVFAQQEGQEDPPIAPGSMYTLHVFTNLIQIPTLVLAQNASPILHLAREQFTLSFDGGPLVRPTQVHLQGADPITLAIVLDASGSESSLLSAAAKATASMAALSLTPQDHLAVFAFDCSVVAIPRLLPGDSKQLEAATEEVLARPGLHGPGKVTPTCYRKRKIWDALTTATNALSRLPGRRVIIALTDGNDFYSKILWSDLKRFAGSLSVSIFAIDNNDRIILSPEVLERRAAENVFRLLTAGTGGLILYATPKTLPETLEHIIDLLRGRYILQFPRPSNSTAGFHLIDVKVPKQKNAIILASGVTVPLPGETELTDPDTVPPDPTRAPTMGTRKTITHGGQAAPPK